MNLLLLLASLAFASEPPCYLRGLDSERDTACINESLRALASGLQVLEKSSSTVNAAPGNFVVDGDLIIRGGVYYAPGSSITFSGTSAVHCVSSMTIGFQSYTGAGTTIPNDSTTPQNNEGFQLVEVTITPRSSSNKLGFWAVVNNDDQDAGHKFVTLFQDSTADTLAIGNALGEFVPLSLAHDMTAGTTSATTFKLRAGHAGAGTMVINGIGTNTLGGKISSGLKVCEYSQ